MTWRFWVSGVMVTLVAIACGDEKSSDDDDSSGRASASASGASGSVASASAAGSGSSASSGGGADCTTACTDLYQCGLESGVEGQLCPGFTGDTGELELFLNGSGGNGCIANCEGNPALAALVNPSDCEGTIASVRSVSPDFVAVCDNGFGG
jgi:hypothetical protein